MGHPIVHSTPNNYRKTTFRSVFFPFVFFIDKSDCLSCLPRSTHHRLQPIALVYNWWLFQASLLSPHWRLISRTEWPQVKGHTHLFNRQHPPFQSPGAVSAIPKSPPSTEIPSCQKTTWKAPPPTDLGHIQQWVIESTINTKVWL